jgi:tRNA (adenine37-N6)-methyltransferase
MIVPDRDLRDARVIATGDLAYRPIGRVHSPFHEQPGTPIQPPLAEDAEGSIELEPTYTAALAGLEGFERIWVLHLFDQTRGFEPLVVPYRDDRAWGLFATRAPGRPNPFGMSALRLGGVNGSTLRVGDVDVLDGSPVLDVTPYVPELDAFPGACAGWLEGEGKPRRTKAERRFERGVGEGLREE